MSYVVGDLVTILADTIPGTSRQIGSDRSGVVEGATGREHYYVRLPSGGVWWLHKDKLAPRNETRISGAGTPSTAVSVGPLPARSQPAQAPRTEVAALRSIIALLQSSLAEVVDHIDAGRVGEARSTASLAFRAVR